MNHRNRPILPADSTSESGAAAQCKPGHEAERKILIVQSAHPDFVLRSLGVLDKNPVFANPRYTLLCSDRPDVLAFFRNHPMIGAIQGHSGIRTAWRMRRCLRAEKYNGIVLVLTGERGYWKIIAFAFLLGVRSKLVFNEHGECFYFSWQAAFSLIRHHFKVRPKPTGPNLMIRALTALERQFLHVPRPVPESPRDLYPGERILILQTAEPACVLRALDRLRQAPLFSNPRYTLFCRALPEVVEQFRNHPMLHETRVHTRTHNSWRHLHRLRNENFDAVVLFLTGDPGYWKMKCFAFLIGTRHRVIFNENNDCFYFKWNAWFNLLAHRMAGRSTVTTHSRWSSQAAGISLLLIKILLFPFRFVWLLFVWLQLRRSAMRASS